MARVRNPKPRASPVYPTSGSIHIFEGECYEGFMSICGGRGRGKKGRDDVLFFPQISGKKRPPEQQFS